MFARFASLLALTLACATAACSSEDGGGGAAGPSAEQAAAFAAFCTGTLKVEQEIMTPSGPGAWTGIGFKVPAGTTVYLSEDFDEWIAYTFTADGTPAKIRGDFTKGLVEDVDFTSDCVERGKERDNQRFVLLRKSTFYADESLGGEACALDAATSFTSYGFSNSGGGTASLQSDALASKCGFDKGYTNDMVYATLITK